ncbi:hypothetical protein ACJX0J_013605, partial [Zea mays]
LFALRLYKYIDSNLDVVLENMICITNLACSHSNIYIDNKEEHPHRSTAWRYGQSAFKSIETQTRTLLHAMFIFLQVTTLHPSDLNVYNIHVKRNNNNNNNNSTQTGPLKKKSFYSPVHKPYRLLTKTATMRTYQIRK